MSFNTGNPVPSKDYKDFRDNCENLDTLLHSEEESWVDRTGEERPTIRGLEAQYAEDYTVVTQARDTVVEARDETVNAKNIAIEARDVTLEAKEDVNTAKEEVITAKDEVVSGRYRTVYVSTRPEAILAAAELGDGATVWIDRDESLDGVRVRYTVASGALTSSVPDTAAGVQFDSFPGRNSTLAKHRPVQQKLSESLHLFDVVTSASEQAAIRNGNSALDLSDTINDILEYLADFPNGGTLNMPVGFVMANNIIQQPKTHIIGDESPIFNETGDILSSSVIYQLPGTTGAIVQNSTDNGWIRNQTSEVDGQPQRYIQGSVRNMTLHLNGNNDLRCVPLKVTRAWGYQVEKCYLKTSNGNFSSMFLDCNTLRINDTTTVGTMFWDSVADSQMWAMQMSGAGNSKTWPVFWMAGNSCWKNQIFGVMPYNNTLNAGAPMWTFTASADLLTLNTTHILHDETPVIVTSTGVLPTGLSEAVTYYVKRIDSSTIKLAASRYNVQQGVYISVAGGSGTHTIQVGKSANIYCDSGVNRNQFTTIRADQSYGSAIWLDGSHDNTFDNVTAAEGGKNNLTGQSAIKLTNDAYGNNFGSGTVDGTTINGSNQIIGVEEDAASAGRNTFGASFNVKNHTNANYKAGTKFSGELHTVWLGTDRFEAISGTPVIGSVGGGRRNAWLFDSTLDEIIQTEVQLPAGWRRAGFRLVWANAGAGSGDVAWSLNLGVFGEGDNLNTADANGAGTGAYAAGAQDVVVHSDLFSDNTFSVLPGQVLYLRVKRTGSAVNDTLPNDAGLVGILVQRLPD